MAVSWCRLNWMPPAQVYDLFPATIRAVLTRWF